MHDWVNPAGQLWFEKRRALFLNGIGRLKPGVTISQAEAQMKTIARQLEQAYPDVNKERSIKLMSVEAAKAQIQAASAAVEAAQAAQEAANVNLGFTKL